MQELFENTNRLIEKEDLGKVKITKPYDPSEIKVTPKNINLGSLVEMLQFKEIDLQPDFQREGNLWNDVKKSQLIESILLGLPLPSFYFSEYDNNEQGIKWAVVDGLQRLSTLQSFIVDEKLELQGLEFLKSYSNKKYNDLSREDKRTISGFMINLYVIEKETPKDVKFLIFKRVNTGGLLLKPQEMRHALNQGIPAKFIKKLAKNEKFRKVTGEKIPTKRQEDRDFANRFVAFYLQGYETKYEGELDVFLNKGMAELDKISETKRSEIEQAFEKSMQLAYDIFGDDAFRKRYKIGDQRRPISKAVYDTISVNFAWLTDSEREILRRKRKIFRNELIELFNDKESSFHKSITTATGQKYNVKRRFEKIKELIAKILEQ